MSFLPGGVIAIGLLIVGMLLFAVFAIYTFRAVVRFRRTFSDAASTTQSRVRMLRARAAAVKVAINRRRATPAI